MDTRILRTTLLADRARIGAYASAALVVAQLFIRAQVPSADNGSEAEQLGASMASGIISALTAPLLYGAVATMILFTILAVTYHRQLGRLQQQQAQHRPPQAPGFGQAPIPPVTWGREN